jgi:phosphoribosylformimino-5-aminoimidazole carboxamide ribonucleotide (ProFAR) isomerase
MGRHKNGVVSFIASRDSSTPPVLELQYKNDTKAELKAVADAYIRPGKFSNKNYGTAETLEVCNSGLKTGKAFDEDTRRTFIAFDLAKADVKKIKNAKLKIRGWLKKTEINLFDHIEFFHDRGLKYLKCSDVTRDGLAEGPNLKLFQEIRGRFPSLHLAASGGVRGIDDFRKLREMGVTAAVFGRAYYEGLISIAELKEFNDENK